MEIDIGIAEADREETVEGLSRLLAETYTLYLKTHNFHWNVTGPLFNTLHLMFEQQYTELALAVDLVAERIRALGFFAPGGFDAYQRLSAVKDASEVPAAEDMIRALVADHEQLARTARGVLSQAEAVGDQASADLLTGRLEVHEKTAWMLRSMLGLPESC
ncbi:MAG: Metalloregulation DNA-binding stress protein [Acidimicrobiales bacterium]|nr:MAG: DNA starvation/stationary phase protection protein [Actinomycetota bacterium]MBV6510467.1 Metalloregulation DNA-binding stress protein [Acidimicrobiales bacterium]RIK02485.1 MAG: DNA starvation/stationary phase protection protein [Acidobacteriota bacterium]